MHGAPQQPAGPIRQQVADVHQDRGGRVVFRAGRHDGDGRPGLAVAEQDLEPRLAAQAEEQGQRAVIGVRARADVVLVGVCSCSRRLGPQVRARRVAEEAQDRAGRTAGAVVGCGEEGGGVYL